MNNIKSLIKWIIILVGIYLLIITWNIKTGQLERFSNEVGLTLVGSILYPGKWLENKIKNMWQDYVDLRGVREENKRLREKLDKLTLENVFLKCKAREWERLRRLLKFKPIKGWEIVGGRVLLYKDRSLGLLNTLVIDVGEDQGIRDNFCVFTPKGLVGQILKTSYNFSTVLLIIDSNSKIPVISKDSRIKGILQGLGREDEIEVKYIPITASLKVGEEFLTSGLGGVFPKGIPVGSVVDIENDPTSLFKKVIVKPFVSFSSLEEVLVLKKKVPSFQKEKIKK